MAVSASSIFKGHLRVGVYYFPGFNGIPSLHIVYPAFRFCIEYNSFH